MIFIVTITLIGIEMIINHQAQPETHGYYSRITNRRIVGADNGAQSCTLWEQTIPSGGLIVAHQHPTEEVLTFLVGEAVGIIAGQRFVLAAGTTVLVPDRVTHSIRNEQDQPVRLLAYFPTATPQVIYTQPPTPIDWEKS